MSMKEGWKMVKLKNICDKASSNVAQKDLDNNNGEYPIYGASGFIKNVDFFHYDKPYIGIVKDGSGIGRVNIYPANSSLLGTLQYILPKTGYELGFVYYALQSLNLSKYKVGAAIPHIYFRDYGEKELSVPPLEEQHRRPVATLVFNSFYRTGNSLCHVLACVGNDSKIGRIINFLST